MGAVLSGTAALGGGISQIAVVAGTTLWTGMIFIFNFFYEFGAYGLSIFFCCFTCCTGCLSKASTEAIRPISEWEGSEAKRGGVGLCVCSCILVCIGILLVSFAITYAVTLGWYETVGVIDPVDWNSMTKAPAAAGDNPDGRL